MFGQCCFSDSTAQGSQRDLHPPPSHQLPQIHLPLTQIMPHTRHRDQPCPSRNKRNRRPHLLHRPERILHPTDKQRRRPQGREVPRPQLPRSPRRMQRIGQQQQPIRQIRLLRRQHGRLPPPIRMPRQNQRTAHHSPHPQSRRPNPIPVPRRGRRRRRPERTPHPVRQIVPQHNRPRRAQRLRHRHKRRRRAVAPRPMCQHDTRSIRLTGLMQKLRHMCIIVC